PDPALLIRRSAGGLTFAIAGGPIHQFVKYCWPMANRLPTNQYRTKPLGAARNMTPNISGIIIMMRCCAGSAVDGVIFCCQNIVTAMSTGVMYNGSRSDKSLIHHPKSAPRNSMD